MSKSKPAKKISSRRHSRHRPVPECPGVLICRGCLVCRPILPPRAATPAAAPATPTWKTADGRLIPVTSMSDAHLLNAIGLIYRKLGPLIAEVVARARQNEALAKVADSTWDPRDDFTLGTFGTD